MRGKILRMLDIFIKNIFFVITVKGLIIVCANVNLWMFYSGLKLKIVFIRLSFLFTNRTITVFGIWLRYLVFFFFFWRKRERERDYVSLFLTFDHWNLFILRNVYSPCIVLNLGDCYSITVWLRDKMDFCPFRTN